MSVSPAVSYDMSFVDNRAPNVAVQFLDRVSASAEPRGLPLPEGRALGVA